MAREIHSTVIDGHRYEMTQLGATPGYQLFTRISKVVIPSIGILVDDVYRAVDRPTVFCTVEID